MISGSMLVDLFDQIQTADSGHHEIHQNQVVRFLGDFLESDRPVLGQIDGVAILRESTFASLANSHLIVDD